MFPFESLGLGHREIGLIVALTIGVAFGFVLERAGFGRATKLAGQFYLHDMTVFKVMFSAIVTAMLGLVLLGGVGVVDAAAVYRTAASDTYVWPMLVGGLVLGVGFIVSGYCPGTSLVASASGKLDGMATFGGVILGSVLFGELYPLFAKFAVSGHLGQRFLDQVTGIPRPVLAMAVALMAVGMFFGAEKVEQIFQRRRNLSDDSQATPKARTARKLVFAGMSAMALLAVATMALPGTPQAAGAKPARKLVHAQKAQQISAAALARRIVDEPWMLRLVDIRDSKVCGKKSLPGAECVPVAKLSTQNLDLSSGVQDLVLIDAGPLEALPRGARTYKGRVYALQGGFAAWTRYALTIPAKPGDQASPAQREAYLFQAAFYQSMTGRKAPPAVKASKRFVPRRKKGKRGGCS